MNIMSNLGINYDTFYESRSLSEQGIDIHVYNVPLELWRDNLRSADSQAVLSEAISAGFIRVMPYANINNLRIDIENQLGYETVPRDFVFLKCVGRCFTVIKPKQEYSIKAKNFIPPQTFSPEVFIIQLTPNIRSFLTSIQNHRLEDRERYRHNGSHLTNACLNANPKLNSSQSSSKVIHPNFDDSSSEGESDEDEENRLPFCQLKRQLTVTITSFEEPGDYVLTPNSKYTQTPEENKEEWTKKVDRSKKEEEEKSIKEMLRRLALDQQKEEQRKRDDKLKKVLEATETENWRKKQEEEHNKLKKEQQQKYDEEFRKMLQKRLQEEMKDQRQQQAEEDRKMAEEQLRKKQEAEMRKKEDEQHKRKLDEELRKKLEEEKQRKEEEEQQKKQKESLRRRLLDQEKQEEEVLRRKRVEELQWTEEQRDIEENKIKEEEERAKEKMALLMEIEQLKEDRRTREAKKEELAKKVKFLQEKAQLNRSNVKDIWKKKYLVEKKKTSALDANCNQLKKELNNINKKILSNVESNSHIIHRGTNQKPSEKNNLKIQAIRLQMEIEELKGRLDNIQMKLTAESKLRAQAEEELYSFRSHASKQKLLSNVARLERQKPNTGAGGPQINHLTSTKRLPPVS